MFFQYQSFDDAPGMVDSKAKLRAFHLPDLNGLSFFDVGCNEGFYCGVALEQGASRVVGLDGTNAFVEAARIRFPCAEFLSQSWSTLPDEKFDVVLHASCMHYIPTKEATIAHLKRLANCLKPNGVLVLEVGIAPGDERNLVPITRHDSSVVYYPQMQCFLDMVSQAELVERFVGISESGDGIERHVFHCRLRRPTILFLHGKSNVGKTRFSWGLVGVEHPRLVSVDKTTLNAFKAAYPEALAEFGGDLSNFNAIDQFYLRRGDVAATQIAELLFEEVEAAARAAASHGWKHRTVVLDGLDPGRKDHSEILVRLKTLLRDHRFILWTAQREF